jgi:hypothetical protein
MRQVPVVTPVRTLRIGQFTGWHGDRANGMAELLRGEIDVLTGDYLAELTMLVLRKNVLRGGVGYVAAFADLLDQHVEEIARRGIKVVTNAGGLDPLGLAAEIRRRCAERGVEVRVAAVTGDDLMESMGETQHEPFTNIDTGVDLDLDGRKVLSANAYLGAWPVVEALGRGADIVVCPRATDASLVVGPAAWHFGWGRTDYDQLAGAMVAGHVIECGAQATGGNFSFFAEGAELGLPGMPIAEIGPAGESTITKSPDSGGLVTRDTVVAQLYYEVGGAAYLNPDVVADLSSIHLEDLGGDKVHISGTTGFAPTPNVKVSLTYEGGYRNTMTVGLTGRNLEPKLAWLQRQVEAEIGDPASFDELRWSIVGPADPHGTFEESTAWAVLTVRDTDRRRVDRTGFSNKVVEIATSNFPGFYLTTPPQKERLYGVQWPTLVGKSRISAHVVLDDEDPVPVEWGPAIDRGTAGYDVAEHSRPPVAVWTHPTPGSDSTEVELGVLLGTRSGDKAGAANIGVWARNDEVFAWLSDYLSVECLVELLPEIAGLRVDRHVFSNLRGLNFMVYQYLGDGVSACTRIDPQAKGMGEYLASKLVRVPSYLLAGS